MKFGPEPYALAVPARQLRDIPSPIALATTPTADTPVRSTQPLPATTPEPTPVRTDVRGAGDGSAKRDVVVIRGGKEIEHRVPNFSREQIATWVCRAQTGKPEGLEKALTAWRTTIDAHDTYAAYQAGQRTKKDSDEAEKKRQDAIGAYRGGSDFLFGMFGGRTKKENLPKPQAGALTIENVDLFTFMENGVEVMAVSGRIHNTGATRVALPPITLEALDRWEFILAGQTTLVSVETLGAGEATDFEIRFVNPPETTHEVYAHFAPPFEYRSRRECEDFDPSKAKLETMPTNALVEAATTPIHTTVELNQLVSLYRRQAEMAWECRDGTASKFEGGGGLRLGVDGSGERRDSFSLSLGTPNMERMCASAEQMLGWRELFVMAEAADEAWGAARASEEAHRRSARGGATQADIDSADIAAQAALARLNARATLALARAGGSASGIAVNLASSTFGYEDGYFVEIKGELSNTGDAPRDVDALMLAIVDRLDLPLMTIAIENPVTLAAGQIAPFSHRVRLRAEPTLRRSDKPVTPSWQVRVGAMAD